MHPRAIGGWCLAILWSATAAATDFPFEQPPGARFDPAIPTLASVVGHDHGEEISSPDEIARFLAALAGAAPERTRLESYGTTWEGRPLHLLILGSRERIARLAEVERDLARLGDPRRLAPGEGERLIERLPAVVWLLHSVHGNEISPADAALATAYRLLAAQGDAEVDAILRDALVLIDPLQNPDGRARFLAAHQLGRALEPDEEPLAAEHDEPWPSGRSNHYLFDLNRDWFALAHPESRGRVGVALRFLPQVAVDLHEMSGHSTFFFAPPAPPDNPHLTRQQLGWWDRFGRAIGARFDSRGLPYFAREVYDGFYPGYGETWPLYQGSIGMTFEQASPRGLRFRRRDGDLLTFRHAVYQHYLASIETLVTSARERSRLLADFLEYRRSAVAEGDKGPVRAYLLPPGDDPARTERLGRLLAAQGIEVQSATAPLRLGQRTLPTGTLVVPAAQPSLRLIRNLLEPQVAIDESFLAEQDRRRQKRLPDQIYDVTAWSLPLAFDLEVIAAGALPAGPLAPFAPQPVAAPPLPEAKLGYFLRWGSAAPAAVAEALAANLRATVAGAPFTLAGKRYEIGTTLFRRAHNPPDLAARLATLAARHGVVFEPIDSAYVEAGISLGSDEFRALRLPKIVLAWDRPAQSLSAGWARYALERRFGLAVSAVRVSTLPRLKLAEWDVLVLPSGDFASALDDSMVQRIGAWVRSGGTLVTFAEASRWATQEKVGLLRAASELRGGAPEGEKKGDRDGAAGDKTPPPPFDLARALEPEQEAPEATPGALLRVALDREHWLAAGSDGEIQAFVDGRRVLTPVPLDRGRNVGLYAAPDRLVASGLVWPDAQRQLAQKAYLIDQPLGEGRVIAFAEDPNFRAFAEATQLLFANAVLLGPAH